MTRTRRECGMGRTIVSQHDSPLGRWTRALYFPNPPLAAHVEMFWYVTGRADFARDRRLPTGKTHLLINLGDAPTLFSRETGDIARRFPTCWISGQQHSYIETGSGGDTILLGAQFHSHGAYRLLRIGQHELCDRVIELEALLGDRVLSLREHLLAAPSPNDCFALLERWLIDQLEQGTDVHPAVLATTRTVAADPGGIHVRALSRAIGWSQEHLIRRFREQVGLTPKAYANILRFDRALGLARRRTAAWSEIALRCGYYDQAHLVRDFQRYAGRAPASLLRDRMPDGDSIVVD
jgi:AraC-like DNA-binding protein